MKTILLSILLVCVAQTAFTQSLAYKMATVEQQGYVSENDPMVKRFDYLLTQLDHRFEVSKEQIADMTTMGRRLLIERGIRGSMLEIMEAIIQVENPQLQYSSYVAHYANNRAIGLSHANTIIRMKGL